MTSLQILKKSFSRSAKSYSEYATLQKDISEYLVRVFVPPGVSSPKRVLDIGCGTGYTSIEAARRWGNARVFSLDIADGMVMEAKKNGMQRVVQADAAHLPFRNGSFDIVISSLAMQWVNTDDSLFGELARVLSPKGLLAFSTLGPGTLAELQRAYDRASRECTGRPAVFRPYAPGESMLEEMKKSGFDDRFCMFSTEKRTYPTVETLFRTLKGIGATLPGRPDTPPRRDVIRKTVALYSESASPITATYELIYLSGLRK